MTEQGDEPVLVVDAGSHSLRLVVLGPGDEVLASRHYDHPPSEVVDEIGPFVATAPPVVGAGHRLVHGGPDLTGPIVLDDAVISKLRAASSLAPLHLPASLDAVEAARTALPHVPHVACPDTAFHAGLPASARAYALPASLRRPYGLRRYGFHGLSYAWALRQAGELLGRAPADLQAVLTHLGGGCSACAVRGGKSVDTTMGMTPLEGLVMTSRSGSVDPGLLLWLQTQHGFSAQELTEDLNHRSGLLGLSDLSDDTRELVMARRQGDDEATVALAVFVRSAAAGLAAMATALDHLDAVVFTGEIGWDQPEVRAEVCARLATLGVPADLAPSPGHDAVVAGGGRQVAVLVVEAHEEREIARETRAVVARLPPGTP